MSAPVATREWWESRANIRDLACWLDEQGELRRVADALDLIDEPWHWTEAWDRLCTERRAEALAP